MFAADMTDEGLDQLRSTRLEWGERDDDVGFRVVSSDETNVLAG
jgi:hypothetical protein